MSAPLLLARSQGLIRTCTVLIALSLLVPQLSDAQSRRDRRRGPEPMADLEVRTVVSNVHAGHLLRAVVGVEEIYQYLIIERIQQGATEGDRAVLNLQERVDKFVVGGRTRAFPSAPDISQLRWQGQVLHFVLSDARVHWRCLLSAGTRASLLPRCDSISAAEAGHTGAPAPPGPGSSPVFPADDPTPKVNWGADPAVVTACGAGFAGAKDKDACLKVSARFVINPTRTIATCAKVMTGGKNKIDCLVASLKAQSDRADALETCNTVVSGVGNRLSCFKIAVRTAWEPSAMIRACGGAVSGARNVLSCMMAAKDAPNDPAAAIEACKKATNGAPNRIKCVGNASQPGK